MFSQVQVWTLAGVLEDIHKVVLKPLLCYLGCVLRVVLLLETEPLTQSEIQQDLEQVIIRYLCLCPPQLVSQFLLSKSTPTK